MSSSFYAPDLAYVHDVGHGAHARAAASFVQAQLQSAGMDTGVLVDLGCGSGIMVELVSQAGYTCIGVDCAAAMIDIARRKAPQATFHVASYLEFDLPPCDIVTSIGECFNYLADSQHGTSQMPHLFRRVHQALRPRGMFLFDIVEPGLLGPTSAPRMVEAEEWTMFLDYSEDLQAQTLTRKILLFRKVGEHYTKSTEIHRLQLFPRSTVQTWLEQCGFTVTLLDRYDPNQPFRDRHVGFLAVKPDP